MLVSFLCLVLATHVLGAPGGPAVVGYWENWIDVDWWANNIPGNCLMGCAQAAPFMQVTAPYSQINYGFTFLTENPDPKQDTCDNSTAKCPVWDGRGIYAAQAYKNGATVVSASSTIDNVDESPALVAIGEVCRLARQGPTGPKRCSISLGGWSDWARIGNTYNAQKLATLAAKMVFYSFADGIDLDFEHLTEFNWLDDGNNHPEFVAFTTFVAALRQEFNSLTTSEWHSNAKRRYTHLESVYNAMPSWQKSQSPYYPTNLKYLQEIQSNPLPYFSISWTTRFNAFLNKTDPWNYLASNSPRPPPFATDNEGFLIWPKVGKAIDSVNVMAYDGGSPAGPLIFDFQQILKNFRAYGPPGESVVMGFEPGDQNAGGKWEGLAKDEEVITFVKTNDFGGAMIWAINPNTPDSTHWCPIVAKAAQATIDPKWPYPPAPVYSKCDPSTGWLPN
jgi:hypothetical protein